MALGIRWSKYWSFSFSKSPSNEYSGLFPLGLSDLISLLSKGLSRIFTSTTVQNLGAFFMVQLSHLYMSTGKTIALIIWTFVGQMMSLLFNMLSRFVIAFLPWSKRLLISWLHSPSAVIWSPRKWSLSLFPFFFFYLPLSYGAGCHDLSFFECWVLSQLFTLLIHSY